MKKILFIILSFSLMACTQTLTVTLDGQHETQIEVKKVLKTQTLITEELETVGPIKDHESCTYMGVCCDCGVDFFSKSMMNCGCGMRSHCSGKKEVTYKIHNFLYYKEYSTDKGQFKTLIKKGKERIYSDRGVCR